MLLIGYGNAGRGDDGLGPALAERIAAANLAGVVVEIDYQLSVDHAPMVAGADLVVFADALVGGEVPFRFTPLVSGDAGAMGSHSLSPTAVLALAETLYGKAPPAWLLGIGGCDFGAIREGLSARAQANLDRAETFLRDWQARQPGRDPAD